MDIRYESAEMETTDEKLKEVDRKLYLRLSILVEQLELESSDRVAGFLEGQIHALREIRRMLPVERR